MNIPLVKRSVPPREHSIAKGPRAGVKRYYRTGLLNTLIYLRPKICLEIGTSYGKSAQVFERYFDEHCPGGKLVTADICIYKDINTSRVHQVQVYPHTSILGRYHLSPGDLLPGWREHVKSSVEDNCRILRGALRSLNAPLFDFVFVDGDHSKVSLSRDLEIVARVVKPPQYALLDDTHDEIHPSCELYHALVKSKHNHYDFEDWDIFPGTSLIWTR